MEKNVQTIRKHASFIILHFPHNCARTYIKKIYKEEGEKLQLQEVSLTRVAVCKKCDEKSLARVKKKLNSAISAGKEEAHQTCSMKYTAE
jgi:hypothetical protein